MFEKVNDVQLEKLLRDVYGGAVGFLPKERQKPWVYFRVGCTVFYWDPWNVCFWGAKL